MYSPIRKLVELKKLRLAVNPLQNASAFSNSISSAAIVNPRKGKNFTVSSYLVDSLGLSRKLAESISRKVSFEGKCNRYPEACLNLLRSHGFTDSQISSIITTYPRLLIADAEGSLGRKLQFLKSRGATTSEFTEILSKVPKILVFKKDKAISRYYDFVKEIVEADKSVKLCLSLPEGTKQSCNKLRNILVLRQVGVPQKLLFSLLISDFQLICGKERFEESLKKVVEMGFDPTSSKFVCALRIAYGLKEKTIEEKFNVYKRLGFTVGDVWEMFKRWPVCLRHSEKKITQTFETLKKCGLLEDEICSMFKKSPQCISVSEQNISNSVEAFLCQGFSRDECAMIFKRYPECIGLSAETVKKKIEFVVKKMNWSRQAVVSNPAVLGYSLEKRTVPRCDVIKALMSKGLLESELPPLSSVLAITNEAFLKKYVRKHDDEELVSELMFIFTGKQRTIKQIKHM